MSTKIHYILLSDSSFRKKNVKKSICYTVRKNILSILFNIPHTQREKVVSRTLRDVSPERKAVARKHWDVSRNKKATTRKEKATTLKRWDNSRKRWDGALKNKEAPQEFRVDDFESGGIMLVPYLPEQNGK